MPLTLFRESVLFKSGNNEDEVLDLQLPLPDVENDTYNIEKYLNEGDDEKLDVESIYYQNQLSVNSSIFTRRQQTTSKVSPKSILWRILKNSKVIELSVLDIDSPANTQFKSIRIVSPLPIFKRCVLLSEDNDNLVIDILVKPGFLYTLQVGFGQFIDDGNNVILSNKNARDWRSIKFPYGFDIRKPYLFHSISSKVFICSTTDGGLVKFFRDSPLGDIKWYQFQDNSKGLSLLTSFLSWNNSNSVPGRPDLSVKTIISIQSVGSFIITVSINRQLKLWSLDTVSVLMDKLLDVEDDSKSSSRGSPLFLESSSIPHHISLASHYNDDSHGLNHNLFITYIPINDGIFKIWQLNHDDETPTLSAVGNEIIPSSPDDKTSIWFISDFKLVSYIDKFVLAVAWKSDTSTIIRAYTIPKGDKNKKHNPYWSNIQNEFFDKEDSIDLSSLNDETNTQSFINKIFGPNGYSKETIKTALPVYANDGGDDEVYNDILTDIATTPSSTSSLKTQVYKTIGSSISLQTSSSQSFSDFKSYNKDLYLQWKRFNNLCLELEKLGNELISLHYDDHNDTFYTIKSSSVSILRPLTELELLYFNRSSSPEKYTTEIISSHLDTIDYPLIEKILRTLHLLVNFRRSLPQLIKNDLLITLKEQFNNREMYLINDRISYMYDEILEGKISESNLNGLNDNIDLDNVIQAILSICQEQEQTQNKNDTFTHLGVQSYNSMLFNYFSTGRIISFDIIILLLLSSSHEGLIDEYIVNYPIFFNMFKSFTGIIELQMNNSNSSEEERSESFSTILERLTVNETNDNNLNLSFLESILVNYIQPTKSLESIWNKLNANEFARFNIIIDLLHQVKNSPCGNKSFLIEYINTYLGLDPFSVFIKGNILLLVGESEKASYYLRSCSIAISSKSIKLTSAQLDLVKRLNEIYWLSGNLNNGLAYYFNSISQVANSIGDSSLSLEFAKYASENLDFEVENESDELAIQIHTTIINTSLDLREYDEAYNSLVELDLISKQDEIKQLVEKFIASMASNGEGLRLCKLPFIGMTNLISEILEGNVGKQTSTLISDYKLLYSWKMERGDYQGAASAIYNQLDHIRLSSTEDGNLHPEYVTIVELYTVAINALYCIENEEDRWIIASKYIPEQYLENSSDLKRFKTDENLFGKPNGYRTRNISLSLKDIEIERDQTMTKMALSLEKAYVKL